VKGRGLFLVKGAQPGMFAPAPNQLDPAANQVRQRDAAAQLVEKARRKGHAAATTAAVGPLGARRRRRGIRARSSPGRRTLGTTSMDPPLRSQPRAYSVLLGAAILPVRLKPHARPVIMTISQPAVLFRSGSGSVEPSAYRCATLGRSTATPHS